MQEIDVADLKRISQLIYEKHNYDFRNYAVSSFKRRVARILEVKKLTVPKLLTRLSESSPFIDEFVDELTVNVTEMFRDPAFWKVIRDTVIPAITDTRKRFRIWHAGCSSGEEVLTMCVVLEEMGLLRHAALVATDIDEHMLRRAQAAAYSLKGMQLNERNYALFGGTADSLADRYYNVRDNQAVFRPDLLDNVSFVRHDLVVGKVFDQFDLILCRNVMIYFNESLQDEVLRKFHESLHINGYLAIGSRESLIWTEYAHRFRQVCPEEKIYRKIS